MVAITVVHSHLAPTLADLPEPPAGRTGWPWTEECAAFAADTLPWPRISIVTPSYNQGCFIEETIRSVLLQGYPNLEYWVCDDSCDDTDRVLARYRPWITVLRGDKPAGMGPAINRGFSRATGDILTFLSSDDIYLPGAFRILAQTWREDPDKGVFVGAFRFMDSRSRLEPLVHLPRCPGDRPIDLTTADPRSWRLHQVATFYGRSSLDSVGCFVREDLINNPDRELLYRVARHGGVRTISEPIAAFRIHDKSKSWSHENMLPMSEEFARVFLLFLDGDQEADRLRRRNARWHRAKGYTRYARYTDNRTKAARALISAARWYPPFVRKKSYIQAWARVMGLADLPNSPSLGIRRRPPKGATANATCAESDSGVTRPSEGASAASSKAEPPKPDLC